MPDPRPTHVPFLEFLERGVDRGGFETDDVLASVLPLARAVAALHAGNRVAPLQGLAHVRVGDDGALSFDPAQARSPESNPSAIDKIQQPASRAIDVVSEVRHTADVSTGLHELASLDIAEPGAEITRPVFLVGYVSWEHAVGHHDPLTDVFSIGLLLASLACGLDLSDRADLERFVRHRTNPFALNRRLHPVIASVIVQATEPNRHRRAPDLAEVVSRLENHRDPPADLAFDRIEDFASAPVGGKRRMIQTRLRERLFEISRRNRLIHFKATLQTLNLTVASVPLVLDYRNIRPEQLFTWHPELAATITGGAPMSLGKYLRFEDASYIPGTLDRIIAEARRDRAEYGFAQLRLVLCFLRWNNLREAPEERIHSPLLLLPVELTRKKGVRDHYVLDPTTSEAEVNPALRHYLHELYGLELPEMIDLKETPLDQFHADLQARIHATEPGVTLNRIDRPQLDLVHQRARQRLDQHRRRVEGRAAGRPAPTPDHSYDRGDFRPLGIQLFRKTVRPTPLPLRGAVDAQPDANEHHAVDPAPGARPAAGADAVVETERATYALREDDNKNPYSWDFDLCSLTLGNFNYRKMTLVRDYTRLIETDLASRAFDSVFSLSPRPPAVEPPPVALADQHPVIPCDAAQAGAIARARTGASYIIQGPPGTGKSQTITNLIADHVARGKRVLFVCEKRAAIDIVFHRLRQQGLDELCCLIHDSQTDKKAFVLNLKQTYEAFLAQADAVADAGVEAERAAKVASMEAELAALRRFADAMTRTDPTIGIPFRDLLHRLVAIGGRAPAASPETEELLPDHALWLRHGDVALRLLAALEDLREDTCFAKHPLRWLSQAVVDSDRPIETLTRKLGEAEEALDAVEIALGNSGLAPGLRDTLDEVRTLTGFAVDASPLAERGLVAVLHEGPAAEAFDKLGTELDRLGKDFAAANGQAEGWIDPLGPDDTDAALALARGFENSVLRFFRPSFWRLRGVLHGRYDFTRHAVEPTWTKIVGQLSASHAARSAFDAALTRAREAWHTDDPAELRAMAERLRADPRLAHPSVAALVREPAIPDKSAERVAALAAVHGPISRLDATLGSLLFEHEGLAFPALAEILGGLREHAGTLAELAPILAEFSTLPEPFVRALRKVPLPLGDFEGAIARRAVNVAYRSDRALARVDGPALARRMERLATLHAEWLALNARALRAGVRNRFLANVRVSSQSAVQLDAAGKAFKKSYAAGRRDLEHEFGKTMRFKSIRDLAAGDTGRVVQDLKPIWLMSPLSVSDTLPLDPELFDVVIFDEASQIPAEEAVPAAYRSHQTIVVGDEMQLPPTTFFASAKEAEDGLLVEEDGERTTISLEADSFLAQAGANLPSALLAWHYRSRHEALISFSNAAFYSGNLFTVPDRGCPAGNRPEIVVKSEADGDANVDALLARSISHHFMERSPYVDRRNPGEASYIARLVRGLLARETGLSVGIVAFSEAQQGEIEGALERLAEEDPEFSARLEVERAREDHDQFCGLFVKNLENVQGDERDVIVMSVCYGPDESGRTLMNFGPVNQRGGEKRLNVIFSRARHHMAIVASIRPADITNLHNDGADRLRGFLQYAGCVSRGDADGARRVLEGLNPVARKGLAPGAPDDAVVAAIATALRARGHVVEANVGQSRFRCDLAVRATGDDAFRLGILVDTDAHHSNPDILDRFHTQPGILRAFGWTVAFVPTKDWQGDPDAVIARIERLLAGP